MKIIGIDGHVLTGKFQGSRTYLENLLGQLGRLDQTNQYVIYSADPQITAALLPFANFRHVELAHGNPIIRLLFLWPYLFHRDKLDYLLTQYNSPPFASADRQLVVIHDVLYESHPQIFPWLMRWRLKLFTRFSAKRAKAVFAVSEFTRAEIIKYYGVPAERIHLTINGFEPQQSPATTEQAAQALGDYLLFVGRLEPRKNVSSLLDAFRLLKHENLHLVIIGAADFSAQEVLDNIRDTARVIHLHGINQTELAAYYRHARIMVYPSIAEGFGLPVLEALSYGTPVICSNQTALPEVGGDLVSYYDPTLPAAELKLAELISATLAIDSRPDPQQLAAHLAKFKWENAARAFLAVVNQ